MTPGEGSKGGDGGLLLRVVVVGVTSTFLSSWLLSPLPSSTLCFLRWRLLLPRTKMTLLPSLSLGS